MQSSSRFAALAVVALLGGGAIWYVGQNTPPSPTTSTHSSVPSSASSSTPMPAPATIEGTWDVYITRPEVLGNNEDNYGRFRLTFESGRWSMDRLSPSRTRLFPGATSTYTVDGTVAHLFSAEDNVTFDIPYTLTATTLTFGEVGPVTFRVKPWTRVATEMLLIGWPGTVANAPGLYSWDGPDHRHCAGGSCTYGFMHRGGGVGISIHGLPHEQTPVLEGLGASSVGTIAGYRGLYQRSVDEPEPSVPATPGMYEEWIVDIDGVVVRISLSAGPGFSEAALADAHAIIDSLRYESIGQAGFRLTFRLTNRHWDSG